MESTEQGRRNRIDAFYEEVEQAAREIDVARFESYWSYARIGDPYNIGYDDDDCVGRVWWVRNPGEQAVTDEDFLKAHPEVTMEDIYERELVESIKLDAFPMFGPRSKRRREVFGSRSERGRA